MKGALRLIARLLRRLVERRLERWLYEERWFIGYRRRPSPASEIQGGDFHRLPTPRSRFFADPIVHDHDGRSYLFFEDYEYRTARAGISCVELGPHGTLSTPRRVLEDDVHLSYPFVFREAGNLYMIPETSGRRTVELYRAVRFPDEWALEAVLLEHVRASDATLLRHGERLWLFVAIALDGGRPFDELFLFSSDSLLGEWAPHPLNPIVSDIRSSRPAGRIFRHGDFLIRPSQDCSRAYGWRVVLNRIEALDEKRYREIPGGHVEVSPGTAFSSIHTYSVDGTYEAVDALERRLRLAGSRSGAASAIAVQASLSRP